MPSIFLHLLLLLFYHLLLLTPPCISQPIFFPLTHTLFTTQYNTTTHLLKTTTTRSATRFHHHHHHQISLPLSPGSDYTLSLMLHSTPPQTISLYMDTGSDLVWFPCKPFTCILCEGKLKPQPLYINLSSSETSQVSCQSTQCSSVHSSNSRSLSSSDLCTIAGCPLESVETGDCAAYSCPKFYYAYADGSFTAKLYQHSFSIPRSSSPFVLKNFTFGCAHSSLAEPIGVAGFGRGELSLPAQLSKLLSPQLGNRFSYCLVSHEFDSDRARSPSPLILGRPESKEKSSGGGESEFVYTQMLENPKHPYFYSVGLAGISVGGRNIPAPESLRAVDKDGNGGMVVDSGTTFTMLPSSLYNSVVAEFERRLGKVYERASRIEDSTGLSPCYYSSGDVKGVINVPSLVLNFVGGKSGVALPRRNYFYEFMDGSDGRKKRAVGCLMLMDGGDEAEMGGGPAGTLGNYQQQGFEVVYDLEKGRVGFARRHCASLWNSLNN